MAQLPDFHIVIPARYASSRFPYKLLADLCGKPVVQWVYELAQKAGAKTVTIATDHESIYTAAQGFGAHVVMTRDDHENGTERLAEVAEIQGWQGDEIIVNVQGDEPLLPIELIHQAVLALANDAEAQMSTLACPISRQEDIFNPNVVKVVRDELGRALYFSRATIPWDRDGFAQSSPEIADDYPAYRHIGLYVYRAKLLANYATMPMSPLERWEKLEQLRFLHQGIPVQVGIASGMPPHGVDTPEDLEALRDHLSAGTHATGSGNE